MAAVNLTSPVTEGDTVTSQTLHDMIETATITGLTAADLAGSAQIVFSDASPPDPSLYSFWFETHHYEPLLRVYARPFNIWLAAGPDRFEIPFRATEPIFRGAALVSGGASLCSIAGTNASLNWIGFAQDSAASGTWVPVAHCGVGWVAADPHGAPVATRAFGLVGAVAGKTTSLNYVTASTATSPLAFGIYLDNPQAGQTWTGCSLLGVRAFIWGPKSITGLG
jgi:hypothetical protein